MARPRTREVFLLPDQLTSALAKSSIEKRSCKVSVQMHPDLKRALDVYCAVNRLHIKEAVHDAVVNMLRNASGR